MPIDIYIRAAEACDVPSILELDRKSPGLAHWSEAEYTRIVGDSGTHVLLVAEMHRGMIVGFVTGRKIFEEWELENIVVAEGHHRQGIASQLMSVFLENARKTGAQKVHLEVRTANAGAIALYEKFGFHRAGLRRAYYSHPTEDAALFSLSLKNSS